MTKRGMRGFAAGLWVAAVVLAYYYYMGPKPKPTEAKPTEVTQAQVQTYLASHSEVAVDAKKYESLKDASKKASSDKSDDKSKSDSSDKSSKQSNDKSSSSSDKETKSNNQVKTYTLKVTSGMTGGEIGNMLERAGILSNGYQLAKYLENHNLENKVQLGTFTIKSNMS
ncbi:MAG TPA: hypothetical protein VFK37_10420, partial [Bacillales bacterium]|nr:hypothetical protein [Bacillales bacterium]